MTLTAAAGLAGAIAEVHGTPAGAEEAGDDRLLALGAFGSFALGYIVKLCEHPTSSEWRVGHEHSLFALALLRHIAQISGFNVHTRHALGGDSCMNSQRYVI